MQKLRIICTPKIVINCTHATFLIAHPNRRLDHLAGMICKQRILKPMLQVKTTQNILSFALMIFGSSW
jgi:hypothetical protein